jgi:hypothetical protein
VLATGYLCRTDRLEMLDTCWYWRKNGTQGGDGLNGWKKLCRDFHFRLAFNTNRNDDQSALKPSRFGTFNRDVSWTLSNFIWLRLWHLTIRIWQNRVQLESLNLFRNRLWFNYRD